MPLPQHYAEQMRNAVESGSLLVVGLQDKPGGLGGIRSREHCILRARVAVPAMVRFQIHGAELPLSHRITYAFEEAPALLLFTHFKPVFDQDGAITLQETFKTRACAKKFLVLFRRAKAHHMFHESAIVPTPVKEDYLP